MGASPGKMRDAAMGVRAALILVLVATGALALISAPSNARSTGSVRHAAPDMIVIHTIGGPRCVGGAVIFNRIPEREDDAKYWQDSLESDAVTGIHYVVGRSGVVAHSVPEMQIANHATGVNTRAIGIELVNRGDGIDPFPAGQTEAVAVLVREIRTRYAIPLSNIVAHSDVDERTCVCGGQNYHRRVDPNAAFSIAALRTAVAAPGEIVGERSFTPLTGSVSGPLCAG